MKIIKKSIYTKYTDWEMIAENVSEYWGKLLVSNVNDNAPTSREWKLVLVKDDYGDSK